MNIADYTRASSYPLSTQGLSFIQGQIMTVQKLCAALGAGLWIIDGCEETTINGIVNITAGTVVIDKEIVTVAQQEKKTKCYIREMVNESPYRKVRELTFGTNVDAMQNKTWGDFERVDLSSLATKAEVEAMRDLAMPKGAIIMWSGSTTELPNGFHLCDGANVTGFGVVPDLRGRFIVGFDARTEGDVVDYSEMAAGEGGGAYHRLTADEMPTHSHEITGETMQKYGASTKSVVALDTGTDPDHGNVTYNDKIGTAGGGQAFDNRPPYYVLAFIIKIL